MGHSSGDGEEDWQMDCEVPLQATASSMLALHSTVFEGAIFK